MCKLQNAKLTDWARITTIDESYFVHVKVVLDSVGTGRGRKVKKIPTHLYVSQEVYP